MSFVSKNTYNICRNLNNSLRLYITLKYLKIVCAMLRFSMHIFITCYFKAKYIHKLGMDLVPFMCFPGGVAHLVHYQEVKYERKYQMFTCMIV